MRLLCNGENISPFLKDWIKGLFYFIILFYYFILKALFSHT